MSALNKAKSHLCDDAARKAYDEALIKFGLPDGTQGGLAEIQPGSGLPTAFSGAEYSFDVTLGDDTVPLSANTLATLKQGIMEDLEPKGKYEI